MTSTVVLVVHAPKRWQLTAMQTYRLTILSRTVFYLWVFPPILPNSSCLSLYSSCLVAVIVVCNNVLGKVTAFLHTVKGQYHCFVCSRTWPLRGCAWVPGSSSFPCIMKETAKNSDGTSIGKSDRSGIYSTEAIVW